MSDQTLPDETDDQLLEQLRHQATAAMRHGSPMVERWFTATDEERAQWAAETKAREQARDELFANARKTTWDGRPLLPTREGERYWRMPDGGLACPLHGRGIGQDYACEECHREREADLKVQR